MKAEVVWNDKMSFTGKNENGQEVSLDAPPKVGGDGKGFRPKELLLDGIAGCTAMDVISILRKMQVLPESFRVEVEAEETSEHPIIFKNFHLKYFVKGDVPQEKLERAIELSQTRYCGVTAMFNSFAEVTHEYSFE
jgi:putative redox protein